MTTEIDRLRAENARLREALGAAVVSMSVAITDLAIGRPSYAASELTSAKLDAVAALDATPPAAETAGQGEQQEDGACTSCGGSGERDHLGHACVPCFGTGKQQEARP